MKKCILTLAIVVASVSVQAQPQRPASPVSPKDFTFTVVKENAITPVKNQNNSGTCWCFSALSFLESESIKAKGIKDPALYPVETEAEWRLIDTILDKVQKEAEARVRKKQSDG